MQRPNHFQCMRTKLKRFFRLFFFFGGGGINAETASFHGGITLASFLVLTSLDRAARWRKRSISPPSSIRQQLRRVHTHTFFFVHIIVSYWEAPCKKKIQSRYSHISLCLFYSSLTKFMLLVVLAIWGPQVKRDAPPLAYVYKLPFDGSVWHLLDDDVLDRTWLVRNLLGGVSAGFGLRGAPSLSRLSERTGPLDISLPPSLFFLKWCSIAIRSSLVSSSCPDA
jgi:hypothetical protein